MAVREHPDPGPEIETPRRDFLMLAADATTTVGVAGAAWPLIDSLNPSADVE